MPWEYTIDPMRNLALVRGVGVVTDEELREGTRAAMNDPRFNPDIRVLSDYSGATSLQITVETVLQLAKTLNFSEKSRRAFLVPSDLSFGLGRMYQAFAEKHSLGQVEVFRERPQAVAWLNEGVPPEKMLL